MPVETPPNPPVERRLPEGLLSQVFGRYRVFVDAWPIVTTLLLLSGAVGIEAHFMLLGINASEVLTLEEYTIYGALGLVIAFAVAMACVAYLGSVMALRSPRGVAWSQRLAARHPRVFAFTRARPNLVMTVIIAPIIL